MVSTNMYYFHAIVMWGLSLNAIPEKLEEVASEISDFIYSSTSEVKA